LEQILKQNPEKKEMIANNLIETVKNCMKKDIINLDLVHTIVLQALQICNQKNIDVCAFSIKVTIGIGITI
jgi:hypothetical protein